MGQFRPLAALLLASTLQCLSQTTTVNLSTQGRNPDFGGFPFTRPITVGATLPATCQVGQLFFSTSAPQGSNLYGCPQTNNWSVLGGYTLPTASDTTLGGVVIPKNSGLVVNSPYVSVNVGTSSGSLAAGDDTRIVGALQGTNNLSDLQSVSTALNNLGLATVATSGSYTDLRNPPTIPSNTNQLINGAGFITAAPVQTVNGQTGAVTLSSTNLTDSTSMDRHSTVGFLPPASSVSGLLYWVTNGSNSTDCKVGGGSYAVPCLSNGSTWVANTVGNGTGGPLPSTVVQTNVTGTQSLTGPLVAPQLNNVFYVSGYSGNGVHTDYDMARQAADAYAAFYPYLGAVLVLRPDTNYTCDAVPLPALGDTGGKWGTTSIIGWGSNVSTILRKPGCGSSAATLSHGDSVSGQLSSGWYQGFTVDANHIDSAACNIYGMNLTTFLDVACGNAAAGSDHEWEFGDYAASNKGWADNIYMYNLKTFDRAHAGKGALLTPIWTNGSLTGVTVSNHGTVAYSPYVRAQLIGPDVSTCSSVPTLTPSLDSSGFVNGAMITNAGTCTSNSRIYILIQDGTPVTYGFKFTNMADSEGWDLEAWGAYQTAEYFSSISSANSMVGEHPFSNATVEIEDHGSANKHINTEFDSPGQWAFVGYGPNGVIENPMITWDTQSYQGSSGYWFPGTQQAATGWYINNSMCANNSNASSNPNFMLVGTGTGQPISATNPLPAGIYLNNAQVCDGSMTVLNQLAATEVLTGDMTNYNISNGLGTWFQTSSSVLPATPATGMHYDTVNDVLWLRNDTGSGADVDGLGVDQWGGLSLSTPIHGDVMAQQMVTPGAPTITQVGTPGTSSYTYGCTAISGLGIETPIGTSATTAIGNSTLSASNRNRVMCPFVEGFSTFKIYRQANAGGLSQGNIGILSKYNFEHGIGLDDSGQAASGSAPVSNLTGNLVVKSASGSNYIALNGTPTGKRTITMPDASGTLIVTPTGSLAYQTILNGSTTLTPRPNLKFANGPSVSITATDNGSDTTTLTIGASTSGGGSAYSSGQFFSIPCCGLSPSPTATGSTIATTANQVKYASFQVPFAVTFTKAAVYISATDSGQTGDVGIMDSTGSTFVYHMKGGAGIPLTPTGAVTDTGLAVTLNPGTVYLLAWTESGIAGQLLATMSGLPGSYGTLLNSIYSFYGSCSNSATAGILPATCGTKINLAGTASPILFTSY